MIRALTTALALCAAIPATAQSIIGCDSWQGQAQAIPESWEENTRLFANGDVRVTVLDTIEPAAGAFYLMIMSPPYDELGGKTCGIVAEGDGQIGFSGMFFQQLGASYDPSVGLTFRVPIERFAPATGGFDPAILAVSVNQATGRYSAVFEIP